MLCFGTQVMNKSVESGYSAAEILSAQQLGGPFQCHVDIGADVFLAQQFVESGFLQRLVYLFVHAGKYDCDLFLLRHQAEVFQVVEKGTLRIRMIRTLGRSPRRAMISSNLVAMPKK